MVGVASVASAMTTPWVAMVLRYFGAWVVRCFLELGVEVGAGLDCWQWKLRPSPRHAKSRARSQGEREKSLLS